MKTKGLVKNHICVAFTTCRAFFLIVLVWAAVLVSSELSSSIAVFIGLFCGVVSISVFSVSDSSGFIVYALTLPYSRRQIVSAQYIFSFLTALSAFAIVFASMMARGAVSGELSLETAAVGASVSFLAALLPSVIALPFIMRLGPEKGRLAYIVVVGGISALAATSFTITPEDLPLTSRIIGAVSSNAFLLSAAVAAGACVLLLISYFAAAALFSGRDM